MKTKKTKKNLIKIFVCLTVGLLFTTLTGTTKASGEKSRTIDSLKTVIETGGHDTAKAKALNKLAWELRFSQPDTAIKLSKKATRLYDKQKNEKGVANCYSNLGVYHWVKSEYKTALDYLNQSLKIYEELGNKRGMASSYINIGTVYNSQSRYSLALDSYFKTLKIYEEQYLKAPTEGNKQRITPLYNSIGANYYYQSNYPKALDYFFKALQIEEELGNKQGMATYYNNIGNIYRVQSDFRLALDYFLKSLKIYKELDNKADISNSYSSIGIIYFQQPDSAFFEQGLAHEDRYPLALEYLHKGLKIKENTEDKKGMMASYINLSLIYSFIYKKGDSLGWQELPFSLGNGSTKIPVAALLDSALALQQRALQISKELSDEYGMCNSLNSIGEVLRAKKQWQEALRIYRQVATIAERIQAKREHFIALGKIAECFEQLHNTDSAYYYYKQYVARKDSIFNEDKSKEIGKLEARHEFEKAEMKKKQEEAERTRILQEETKRRNILQYSGILIFIVVFFIILLFSGKLNIPIQLAEGGVFFTFLLVFEFLLVLTSPYIGQLTGGEPIYQLIANAALAALIFPVHSIAETKLKQRLFKTKQKSQNMD